MRLKAQSCLSEVWLPGGFDYVAVGIKELDADVLWLVPLLDDRDAVGREAVPETADGVRARKMNAEVQKGWHADRLVGRPERERNPSAL